MKSMDGLTGSVFHTMFARAGGLHAGRHTLQRYQPFIPNLYNSHHYKMCISQ